MFDVFSETRIPREYLWTIGGPAPSSKIVIEPSGWNSASCWNAVVLPVPILKLEFFPPSVQLIFPVLRSTSYTAEVLRIEITGLLWLSNVIELAWKGSNTNPGDLGVK